MAGRRRTDPATVGAGRLPERRDRAEHLAAGATAAGSLTGNGCWLGARAALTFLGFQRRPHMGYPGTVETFSAPQATAADIRTAVPVFILMSDDSFLPLGLRRDMRAVRSLWRRLNRQSRRLRSGEAGAGSSPVGFASRRPSITPVRQQTRPTTTSSASTLQMACKRPVDTSGRTYRPASAPR